MTPRSKEEKNRLLFFWFLNKKYIEIGIRENCES